MNLNFENPAPPGDLGPPGDARVAAADPARRAALSGNTLARQPKVRLPHHLLILSSPPVTRTWVGTCWSPSMLSVGTIGWFTRWQGNIFVLRYKIPFFETGFSWPDLTPGGGHWLPGQAVGHHAPEQRLLPGRP